jgi:hypothetical protein
LAADNPLLLVDAFAPAGNGKKLTLPTRRFATGRGKGKNKKGTIIAVCNKLLAPVFAVEKSGVQYEHDYFKKLA